MDTCNNELCSALLARKKHIHVINGKLYCCKTCSTIHQHITEQEYKDNVELVIPSDIGVLLDGTEEPLYCITGVYKDGIRFIKYTSVPQHYNIWMGTLWKIGQDGARKKIRDYK